MRLLSLVLLLHSNSAGHLNLNGPDSKISMGGATLQAYCGNRDVAIADSSIVGGQLHSFRHDLPQEAALDVVLQLLNVPPTCAGISLSQPCASTVDTNPRLFFSCTWEPVSYAGSNYSTRLASYPNELAAVGGKALLGIEVLLGCPLPTWTWVYQAFGVVSSSPRLNLHVHFHDPVSEMALPVPFQLRAAQHFTVPHGALIRAQIEHLSYYEAGLLVHIESALGSDFHGYTYSTAGVGCDRSSCAQDFGIGMNWIPGLAHPATVSLCLLTSDAHSLLVPSAPAARPEIHSALECTMGCTHVSGAPVRVCDRRG